MKGSPFWLLLVSICLPRANSPILFIYAYHYTRFSYFYSQNGSYSTVPVYVGHPFLQFALSNISTDVALFKIMPTQRGFVFFLYSQHLDCNYVIILPNFGFSSSYFNIITTISEFIFYIYHPSCYGNYFVHKIHILTVIMKCLNPLTSHKFCRPLL